MSKASEEALALAQQLEDFGETLKEDEAAECIRSLVAENAALKAALLETSKNFNTIAARLERAEAVCRTLQSEGEGMAVEDAMAKWREGRGA